jgi:hypothetical protein
LEGAGNSQADAAATACRPACWGVVRELLTDRSLHAVLLVWALCWLGLWIYLSYFSTSLPFCDEWDLSQAASRSEPLTWRWLWRPANEHRAPLTRLEVLLLGWLEGWDLRLARYVNLGLLALGAMTLILAVRSVRGRSALSDAFLGLLVLTPCQYQSVLLYAYAYAMALACFCLALSAVVTGWPLRSLWHLAFYLALIQVVNFSGGPAGNVWAVGLCGVFVRGWLEGKPRSWKWAALAGSLLVMAASLSMLLAIPSVPGHSSFRSDCWGMTVWAANRLAVGWLGGSFLAILYPWAWLLLAMPWCYVLGRMLVDLDRLARRVPSALTRLMRWLDLVPILLAALVVAIVIGHGRAYYPDLWDSRYATLLLPIGVVTYLLLVRLRAPMILAAAMSFVMAVSVGWNWPEAIRAGTYWHDPAAEMARALKMGQQPLSAIALRYASKVGYVCNPDKLLNALLLLREANLCVFRNDQFREPVPGMGRPLVWKAANGQFDDALQLISDGEATKGQAIEAASTQGRPGTALYEVDLPASGSYLLCCRLRTPAPGHVLGVQVDDRPVLEKPLPTGSGYYPYCLDPLLDLGAGHHRFRITLFQRGTRLDLLELIPKARQEWGSQNHG